MVHSQIFIYILALTVTALILLYGYSAISKFLADQEKIAMLQFKNSLTNEVDKLGYEFGSVVIKDLVVPRGVTQVCFVWLPEHGGESDPRGPAIIEQSTKSGSKDNAFIMGNDIYEPFNLGKVSVEENLLCLPAAGGHIKVRLEARGSLVHISSEVP